MLLILAAALVIWRVISQRRHLTLRSLLSFILLAGIHGTFLSQQLWGSTYAIWPFLLLLLADLIAFLAGFAGGPQRDLDKQTQLRAPSFPLFSAERVGDPESLQTGPNQLTKWLPTTITTLIVATLLILGSFYTASEERLNYLDLPDGPIQHSAFPVLAGMSTPGPYLPEMDELLRYAAANIPFNDGLILRPAKIRFTLPLAAPRNSPCCSLTRQPILTPPPKSPVWSARATSAGSSSNAICKSRAAHAAARSYPRGP